MKPGAGANPRMGSSCPQWSATCVAGVLSISVSESTAGALGFGPRPFSGNTLPVQPIAPNWVSTAPKSRSIGSRAVSSSGAGSGVGAGSGSEGTAFAAFRSWFRAPANLANLFGSAMT